MEVYWWQVKAVGKVGGRVVEEYGAMSFADGWKRLGKVVQHSCGYPLWVRAFTRLEWASSRCVEYRDAANLDHSLIIFHCPLCKKPLRLWWDEQARYSAEVVAVAAGPDEHSLEQLHCLLCAEVVYGVAEVQGLVGSVEQCGTLLYPGGESVFLRVLHAGARELHGWSCVCGKRLCDCGCGWMELPDGGRMQSF